MVDSFAQSGVYRETKNIERAFLDLIFANFTCVGAKAIAADRGWRRRRTVQRRSHPKRRSSDRAACGPRCSARFPRPQTTGWQPALRPYREWNAIAPES